MNLIERAEDLASRCIPPASGLVRELIAKIEEQQREIESMHRCFDAADMERAKLRADLDAVRSGLIPTAQATHEALRYVVRVFVVDDDDWDHEAETDKSVARFIEHARTRIDQQAQEATS